MTYLRLKWLTFLWMAGIVVLSLSPGEVKVAAGTETKSKSFVVQHRVFHQHRAAHYVAFAVGAVLLAAVGRSWPSRAFSCIALIGLGCSLEWVQSVLFHNVLETWDMRDDAAAVVLGFLIAVVLNIPGRAPQPVPRAAMLTQ